MIVSFSNQTTEDFYHGRATKRVMRFEAFAGVALRKLDMLNAARSLNDLPSYAGPKGHHSIQINDQWWVLFMWHDGNALLVQITDSH